MMGSDKADLDGGIRIPIVEERLQAEKEKVVTGRVRVASRVVCETLPVRGTLENVHVQVEHVLVDRFVDAVPPVRTQGNRTIVSVTEEVMVKRIRLVEEIHLIKTTDIKPFNEEVTLRRTEVDIARD